MQVQDIPVRQHPVWLPGIRINDNTITGFQEEIIFHLRNHVTLKTFVWPGHKQLKIGKTIRTGNYLRLAAAKTGLYNICEEVLLPLFIPLFMGHFNQLKN
ncbi:hypothetical protein D3C86_1650010 [compost metagenome]